MTPSRSVQVLGVASPLVAVAVAAPFTLGALGLGSGQLFLAAPTLVGCAAAPGYFCALLRWRSMRSMAAATRWWIRGSFVAVIGASLVGSVFSLVLILPSIGCVLTAVNAAIAWRRLEA